MIDPNELRRGNLVYTISRRQEVHMPVEIPFKILEILTFEVTALLASENPITAYEWPSFPYSDLSPIPLTPEILEKLGFENINPKQFYRLNVNNSGSIIDLFNDNPFHYVDGNFSPDVPYLHQLQNLHFALAGSELDTSKILSTHQ